jgi:hypothetical protein
MNAPASEVIERELPGNIDTGVLAVISKAEIDVQIATAHRFPRSVKAFRDEALAMVTLTEAIAEECIYALPRDGKTIEGPSARFAEVIISAWGNSRSGARVVDDSGEFVTAQGVFHDLQKNVAITYEVKRRITDKRGRRYNPDMIGVTANAACSIALRNAILKGVPKAFWSDIYEAARKTIMGDFQTLANRRAAALNAFQKFGVTRPHLREPRRRRRGRHLARQPRHAARHAHGAEGRRLDARADVPAVEVQAGDRSASASLKAAATGTQKPPAEQPKAEAGAQGQGAAAGQQNTEVTVLDHIAKLAGLNSLEEISTYADGMPEAMLTDERWGKATKARLDEINKASRQEEVIPAGGAVPQSSSSAARFFQTQGRP